MDKGLKCLGDAIILSVFNFQFSIFIKFVQEKDIPCVVELSAGVLPDVVIDKRVGIIPELARRFPCSFQQFLPADGNILDVQLEHRKLRAGKDEPVVSVVRYVSAGVAFADELPVLKLDRVAESLS